MQEAKTSRLSQSARARGEHEQDDSGHGRALTFPTLQWLGFPLYRDGEVPIFHRSLVLNSSNTVGVIVQNGT